MQFDRGYLSPYFVNKPETASVELEDPFILLVDKKISNVITSYSIHYTKLYEARRGPGSSGPPRG